MRAFIRKIISSLIFFNILKRYKGRAALVKIKAAQAYVAGVEKVRILLLGVLFVIFSFILLGSGLFLMNTALFTYSSWSPEVKFIVALLLGAAEFLVGMIILFYLFREKTWVEFYGIQKVLNSVVEDKASNKKERQ